MKFKLVEAAESKICCICKKPFEGYGNNAEPVCSGSCCDECNMKEVIPARMKMLDNSSSEDIDEAVINEALEDYKLTYYLSTATAERRPETIEDVENDWKEETFAADSDYDACRYAFSIIHDIAEEDVDEYLTDYDIKDVKEFVEYCDEKDLGDGSAFIVKLEGPNGVIYDMGQTKDEFIEQVKENDEMLDYYRNVLGIDESLNEGNPVSGKIPPALDSFLQDIAQMYGTIDYGDIMDHDYTEDDIRKLNNLRRRFITWSQYDEDDEEVKAKFNEIANKVADILKRVDENINTIDEKDNSKMNEDMSVRAKLKALYPELNFGNKVEEAINETDNSRVTLEVMFEEYERYDIGATRKAKVSGKDLLSALKKMVDKMGLYLTSSDIEEANLSAEKVIESIESTNGDGCDFIFYIKNLTTGEMLLQDSYEDEEDWDDEEDLDDDNDFDIDESHEIRLMDSLYEGSDDFDDYDDEDDDEFSDCEDDECIDEEDVEYDDEDPEWWNDTLDDETGDFIYQAAEQLGLEDFWFEDNGYEGAHTPTDFGYTKDGITYEAECDYEDTDVHSVEEAVDLLKGLDWKRA